MDTTWINDFSPFALLQPAEGVGGVLGAEGGQPIEGVPAGAPGDGTAGQQRPADPFGNLLFPIMIGFLVLMVVTTMMSGRRERKEKAKMMSAMGKRDKVQMGCGIIGIITDISDAEVVIRVDESTKTNIRFAKSAVARVLDSANDPTPSDSDS